MAECLTPIAESNNFIVLDRYTRNWKVAEGYQSEDALEQEFIDDLVAQGYEFLPRLSSPQIPTRRFREIAKEMYTQTGTR